MTGYNRLLDADGQRRFAELMRQGLAVVSELNAQEATENPVPAQTFEILRRVMVDPGMPHVNVLPTYGLSPGLDNIEGTVVLPDAWNVRRVGTEPELKSTQRIVFLVDQEILPTDRIRYNDPIYGAHVFRVVSVMPNHLSGIYRATIEYAREEGGSSS
jgi:hypothetical protein